MITNNNTIGSHHNTATTVAVVTSSETPTASAPAAGVAAAASTSTLIKRHDVLCGRGKGIPHSHVGNKNYRRLIHENSNLYTKCHANDKKKITRGIVTAVRNAGGRFISYDRRRNTVSDIGDEKAFVKTSQAIRDKINKKEDEATFPFNTSNNVDWNQELPQKWYTDYSSQLLKSVDSSNAVTAGNAPQNERVVLVQNHQEVPAYTSTPALSNPFHHVHQGHVTRTRARDAHQY